MKRSVERILTTHVGSLPRPADLIEAWRREPPESAALAETLRRAVRDIVHQQADVGLDVLNDGEFGKPVQDAVDYGAWMKYVGSRMSGFDLRMGATDMFPGKDRAGLQRVLPRTGSRNRRDPALRGGLHRPDPLHRLRCARA